MESNFLLLCFVVWLGACVQYSSASSGAGTDPLRATTANNGSSNMVRITAIEPSLAPSAKPSFSARPSNTNRPSYFPTWSPTQSGANVPTVQFQALHDLYLATNGSSWDLKYSDIPGNAWNFSTPSANPCLDEWIGVTCNGICWTPADCLVTELQLVALKLVGFLPASIGNIDSLLILDLSKNFIRSTIPDSIGKLHNLTVLSLAQNGFYGTIPDMFMGLQNLTQMDLSTSQLSGSLPASLYNLTKIEKLDFGHGNLTGSISDRIVNLFSLTSFSVRNNNMNGSIPEGVGYLTSLESLILAENELSGSIPLSLLLANNLSTLDFSTNFLTGKIPMEIGQLSSLKAIIFRANYLTGTFPTSIMSLVNLKRIDISYNLLTSSVPSSLAPFQQLISFAWKYNFFTGQLPDFSMLNRLSFAIVSHNSFTGTLLPMINAPYLFELNVGYNLLTGTMPNSTSTILFFYFTEYNFFTGPIPAPLAPVIYFPTEQIFMLLEKLDIIDYLDPSTKNEVLQGLEVLQEKQDVNSIIFDVNLESNLLTGTIPSWITNSSIITYIYLGNNYLTGTIPDWILPSSVLAVFSIFNNELIGSIPASFELIKEFVTFDVSKNKLTGSIPHFILKSDHMEVLLMQNNAFSGIIPDYGSHLKTLVTVDFSNNDLTGTIPPSFFHRNMTSLLTFAASANCFTGYVPDTICNVTSLQTLVLDGLSSSPNCREPLFPAIKYLPSFTLRYRILGSIPTCLFQMPNLQSLYLSGNGFKGSLPTDLKLACNINNLVLSHNTLLGRIPTAIQQRAWESLDLSYNKFFGFLDSDGFETNDAFDCGFNATSADDSFLQTSDEVYLDVNRLSGTIPPNLLSIDHISMLNDNIFSCGETSLEKKEVPSHDPKASSYDCGSDSVNMAMYVWVAVLGVLCLIGAAVWAAPKEMKLLADLRASIVHRSQQMLLWKRVITQVERGKFEVDGQTVFLQNDNPIYLLHKFMKLVRLYALYFLIFLLVVCTPVYMALSHVAGTYVETYAWRVSSAYISGYGPGLGLMLLFMLLLTVVYYLYDYQMTLRMRSGMEESDRQSQQFDVERTNSTSVVSSAISALHRANEVTKEYQVLFIVGMVNMTVVTFMNVGYIIGVISLKSSVAIGVMRLLLTLSKLSWNEYLMWRLLATTKRTLFRSLITDKADLYTYGRRVTSKDMFLSVFSILFNNNIAPCISVAIVSPSCFYNAFVAPKVVESSYTYCDRYSRLGELGVVCIGTAVGTSSYNPPYIYNYNCANLLPANYVQVYAYMVLFSGIVSPLLRLSLKYVQSNYIPKGSKLHRTISDWLVAPLLRDYQATRIPAEGEKGFDYSRSSLFNKHKFIVVLVSYLTLLVTFGSVFPPLAIVIWIALCVRTWYETLLIGKAIHETKQLGYDWYVKQLRRETEGISELFTPTILPITFVASLLYAYMVFDTTGDTEGFQVALGPSLALLVFAICMWPAVRVNWKKVYRQWEARWKVQSNDESRKKKAKSIVADSTMVEMVIQAQSGSSKTDEADAEEKPASEEEGGDHCNEVDNPLFAAAISSSGGVSC